MALETFNIGTTPLDGTGDKLRTAFSKVKSNFEAIEAAKHFGVYNYNHNGGTQAIPATTWTTVVNDGLGAVTFTAGGLPGVSIFNIGTNRFDYSNLDIYDTVDLRFDANITTTAANQEVRIRLIISEGVLNIPLTFASRSYKTAGTYPLFGFLQSHIFSAATRDNPARLEVYSDAACTLALNGYAVKAIKATLDV